MAESFTLDPEFEAVLTEVAADPDSILLRVPRPKVVRTLMDSDARFSPMSAGLSTAERELVAVWRSELAWLLREACVWQLVHGAAEEAVFIPYEAPDRLRAMRSIGELQHGADALTAAHASRRMQLTENTTAATSPPDTDSAALVMLNRGLRDHRGSNPTLAQMAAMSHRLAPTQEARLLAAIDFARGTTPLLALRIARALLSEPLPDRRYVQAWECVAVAYAHVGDFGRGLQACEASAHRSGWDFHNGMNRLLFTVSLGQERAAAEASSFLSDAIAADHPAVDLFVSHHLALRRTGRWRPTGTGVDTASRRGDQFGAVGRRIANVFL